MSEQEKLETIIQRFYELMNENKDSIELTKNTRGYSWNIKVYDDDEKQALAKIYKINKELEAEYKSEE